MRYRIIIDAETDYSTEEDELSDATTALTAFLPYMFNNVMIRTEIDPNERDYRIVYADGLR